MVQYFPVITGSLVVQGSVLITGSINTTAGITGSFSGTATTAQTASSVANLNQNVQITGSLTTSGTITAQTLNVQQVTSSIVFSSGSNVFGNSLSNRQQMTGSLSVTGSIASFTGNMSLATSSLNWNYPLLNAFQIRNSSFYGYDNYELGIQTNAYYDTNWRYISTGVRPWQIQLGNDTAMKFQTAASGSAGSIFAWTELMRITPSGSIGIGTSNVVEGTQAASSISIFPSSSVSSGPLIQFPGNGRIRPASAGDRLSIDGNALFLNSAIGGNIIMNTAGGGVAIGTASPGTNTLAVGGSASSGFRLAIENTAAGSSGTNSMVNITNTTDADLQLHVTKVGATSKYAMITPSVSGLPILLGAYSNNVGIGIVASNSVVNANLAIARDGAYPGDVSPSSLALCGLTDPRMRISMGYDTVNNYGFIVAGQLGVQWTSLYLQRTSGAVYAGTARIDNNSDVRVKDNIQPITNALDKVLSITGKKFHMLDEPEDKIRLGFIAQELQGVVDELVIESDRTQKLPSGEIIENVLGLETWGSSWAALLVEAIKELSAKIDQQQAEINELRNRTI